MRYTILLLMATSLIACSANDSEPLINDTPNEDIVYMEESDSVETDDLLTADAISENIKSFKEFETIDKNLTLQKHSVEVVEDNVGKRILLIKDENNDEVYKTIYTKENHRLKIIEIEKGQIFNKKIS